MMVNELSWHVLAHALVIVRNMSLKTNLEVKYGMPPAVLAF